MANQFLVEIHDYLSRNIEAAKSQLEEDGAPGDKERRHFNAGKLDELNAIRAYISEKFDLITQKYY